MESFQHSIEISVPVHVAYEQLIRFEEYPRFMNSIDDVRRVDDTHLHWRGSRPDPGMEWDSEITEQIPDRCIAWHNLSDPPNDGRVDLEPLAPDRTGLTMTMECDPLEFAAMRDGDMHDAVAERIRRDLVRLKDYIEMRAADPEPSSMRQVEQSTQSDYSLSRSADLEGEDGRFDIAEEINFDEQSDQARHIGRMPDDASIRSGMPRTTR